MVAKLCFLLSCLLISLPVLALPVPALPVPAYPGHNKFHLSVPFVCDNSSESLVSLNLPSLSSLMSGAGTPPGADVFTPEQRNVLASTTTQLLDEQAVKFRQEMDVMRKALSDTQAAAAAATAAANNMSTTTGNMTNIPGAGDYGDDRDSRFNKLQVFSNKEEDFEEWSFKLKAAVATLMSEAAEHMEELEEKDAQPSVMMDFNDVWKKVARKLYFGLVMITKGNGNRIVKNVRSKNGFEVYRLLCQRYNPRTDGKFLVLLNSIIEFQFGTDKEFLDNLVAWETMIDNFEADADEEISPQIKCAILSNRAPKELRKHLLTSASRETNYVKLRQKVETYIQ